MQTRHSGPMLTMGCLLLVTVTACANKQGPRAKAPEFWHSAPTSRVTLPMIGSRTALREAVAVTLAWRGVWVENRQITGLRQGRLDANLSAWEGPGQVFLPLLGSLRSEARILKLIERQGGTPFRGQLALFCDGATSYKTLRQVLYTALRADFRIFQLVGKTPHGAPSLASVMVGLPERYWNFRVPSLVGQGARNSVRLRVYMTPYGFSIRSRHGDECSDRKPAADASICVPTHEGRFTPRVHEQLAQQLWRLFGAKYKDESLYATPALRHSIEVVPSPEIRTADLLAALEAMRDIPRDATKPPAPADLAPMGCRMTFDAKSASWAFGEHAGVSEQKSCMYYRVNLRYGR